MLIRMVNHSLYTLQAILTAGGASAACALLWILRGDMWELLFLIVVLGVVVIAGSQLWKRRLFTGNTLAALLLLAVALTIPRVIPTYRQIDSQLARTREPSAGQTNVLPTAVFGKSGSTSNMGLAKIIQRLSLLRHNFINSYPLAGSNVDTAVELNGIRDVIVYLPRAMEIGLLSPFPNMWFARGEQVGRQGRLVSGFETLSMYVVIILALVTIIVNRRCSVGLVAATAILGCTALGYVVVNISALYRMRYGFWILLIVLGAKGLIIVNDSLKGYRQVSGS